MLDATLLANMRATLETSFMPYTLQIYNVTHTNDIAGKRTYTRTLAQTVTGQIAELSNSERTILAKLVNEGTEIKDAVKAVIPVGVSLTATQQVLISGVSNDYYNVIPPNLLKTFAAAQEVYLTRSVIASGVYIDE